MGKAEKVKNELFLLYASDRKTEGDDLHNTIPDNLRRRKKKERKEFSCEVCGKSIPSAAKLRDHLTVHTDKRIHICPHDGLCFKTKDNLKQHLNTHSSIKYECDHCGKLLKNKTTLGRHMNEHNRSKTSNCPRDVSYNHQKHCRSNNSYFYRCGKIFANKVWLEIHIARHDEDRCFVCPHLNCEKSFYSKPYLHK